MRNVLRTIFALLLAVLLVSFFTACGQNKEEAKPESETAETEQPAETPSGESEQAQESNRGTASAIFGEDTVSINYGRPQLQGRDMLGQATEGMVWRMGMNEATEITTDADLTFGDTTIPKGQYSLWMKKVSGDTWELLFNEKTGIWGRPSPEEGYFATVPMMMSTSEDTVETFTVEVAAQDETSGSISAMWGTAVLRCDFTVGGTN